MIFQLYFVILQPNLEIEVRKDMKKTIYAALLVLSLAGLASCNNYETYSDLKEAERDAIDAFIAREGIQVISEDQFKAQGLTTDTASNQYVHLSRTGVYMQIRRQGCGSQLEDQKRVNVLCRFMEKNIKTDSVMIRNDQLGTIYLSSLGTTVDVSQYVDKMNVYRNGTTITASFVSGMMYMYHGSTSVPGGWLVPLNYVGIGRPANDGDEIALVRLIVPHSQGTADASSSVYPCYYEITYVREK